MSSELRKYGSTSVVQTSNISFTSEVSDYLVVHTGHDLHTIAPGPLEHPWRSEEIVKDLELCLSVRLLLLSA